MDRNGYLSGELLVGPASSDLILRLDPFQAKADDSGVRRTMLNNEDACGSSVSIECASPGWYIAYRKLVATQTIV
jgi:hypothetical protein